MKAWNVDRNYWVTEPFDVTITGGDPINVRDGKARWKVRPKGDGCMITLKKSFESLLEWSAKLRFKGQGLIADKTTRGSGDDDEGQQTMRNRAQVSRPEGKIKYALDVTSAGSFFFKGKKSYDCQ